MAAVNKPFRMGLIYPGGGAEQDFYHFARVMGDRIVVYLTPSRVGPGEDHSLQSLRETARIEYLVEAAQRLVDLHPDVVMWACTSGSFVVRRAGAEAQVAAITRTVGVPSSSTSLAFAHAVGALGYRRVAVAATYPLETSATFASFLGEFGLEVVSLRVLGAKSGWDAGRTSPEVVSSLVGEANRPEAEAVLIPDTALPTLSFIEALEMKAGKAVLTANQVTLWEALTLGGWSSPCSGYGKLMRRIGHVHS